MYNLEYVNAQFCFGWRVKVSGHPVQARQKSMWYMFHILESISSSQTLLSHDAVHWWCEIRLQRSCCEFVSAVICKISLKLELSHPSFAWSECNCSVEELWPGGDRQAPHLTWKSHFQQQVVWGTRLVLLEQSSFIKFKSCPHLWIVEKRAYSAPELCVYKLPSALPLKL